MNRKSMGVLAAGLGGAVVGAFAIYWNSHSETPFVSHPDNGGAVAFAGRDRPAEAGTAEPETAQQPAVARTTPPIAAEPSLSSPAQKARPDAGYYDNLGKPYGVAGFLFFFVLTNESIADTDISINKIREATRVDENTARRFLAYATQAKDLLQQYQLESHSQLCAQRTQIGTISQLAGALKSADGAVENRRAQLVRGSESILGIEGMRNFETYLSNKDRNQQPVVESNEDRLNRMNKTPAEVFTLLCDPR